MIIIRARGRLKKFLKGLRVGMGYSKISFFVKGNLDRRMVGCIK